MLHEDRRRALSFGADPARYDRTRPSYPGAMVDALLADRPAPRVLDVGCGTGISARLFAERGCPVLGVEADARMAAFARRQGLEVEEAPFEDWDDRGRRFDLATCAQAWHWIEPTAGANRLATVLAPAGRVAIFWNKATFDEATRRAMEAAYRRVAPGLDRYSILLGAPVEDRVARAARALRSDGHFGAPEVTTYGEEVRASKEEWLDLLPTHSDHRTLPPSTLEALLGAVGAAVDGLGGALTIRYTTWLVRAELE